MDGLWNVRWMTDHVPMSKEERARVQKLRVYTSKHIAKLSHDSWSNDSANKTAIYTKTFSESAEDGKEEEEQQNGDSGKIVIAINEEKVNGANDNDDDNDEDKDKMKDGNHDQIVAEVEEIYDAIFEKMDEVDNENEKKKKDNDNKQDTTQIEMEQMTSDSYRL